MRSLALWFGTLLFSVGAGPAVARHDLLHVQDLVNDLKSRLSISASVIVDVVPVNSLLVSVEPMKDREDFFTMSFESALTEELTDDELRAVIAHELGHVWIFTHHPYLQTERLANEVAMRIVSRESLQRAYAKVWEREGVKGDLARFLGDQ